MLSRRRPDQVDQCHHEAMPKYANCTKANFDKCIRNYLETVAEFQNIGDQLICWLRISKKPALMPMHKFMWHQVQLLNNLEGSYLC